MRKNVVRIKRVYDKPLKKDGHRVLVERFWPRGLTVKETCIDDWIKAMAPSVALHKWFRHDPDLWHEFRGKYLAELEGNRAVQVFFDQSAHRRVITLVYAAKDTEHNHAIVLQEYLSKLFAEH